MIYSASSIWAEYKFGNEFKFFISQGIFLIAGFIGMNILERINYKIYEKYANKILLICLILLILRLLQVHFLI